MSLGPPPTRRRAVLLAALLVLVVGARGPLVRTARMAREKWTYEFDKAQNLGAPEPAAAPAPKPAEPVPAPPATAVPPKPAVPEPPRVASRPPEPAPAPAPSAGRRAVRLYGVVYGLAELEPVEGARVSIHGPGGAYDTRTDRDGRYQIDLPAAFVDSPLTADVDAPGWRSGQLEDVQPPYLERSAEERRAAAAQLAPGDLDPVRLSVRPNALVFPLDLVLLRPESPKKGR